MSNAPYLSPSGTFAPWAEAVRTTGRFSVDDLAALPNDGWQYELVEGALIRMPASGYEVSTAAAQLLARLGVFVEDHALGAVTGADGGYRLDPDLAVEVASPVQTAESLALKARVYLSFGTRLVWVVWPMREQVDIWHRGAEAPVMLSSGHILNGEDVVPGFSYPVASLFR